MVGAEQVVEIRVLHRHGTGIREIARETGLSRNTIRRYLRNEAAPRYTPRPHEPRSSTRSRTMSEAASRPPPRRRCLRAYCSPSFASAAMPAATRY